MPVGASLRPRVAAPESLPYTSRHNGRKELGQGESKSVWPTLSEGHGSDDEEQVAATPARSHKEDAPRRGRNDVLGQDTF